MKLKSKLLSSIALISLATSVAPISLSSCSNNTKHEKEVTIPTIKLDTSVSPKDIDMNSQYVPFTCENASDGIPAAIKVELPSTLGISMYYRTPVQSQVGWGEWIALEPDEENYIEFEAGYKVQLVGYCSENTGKAFSSYGNQIKIDLSNAKTRETDVPKFKIGGSAYSFLATQDPTEHTEKEISCATQIYSEYEFKNLFNGSEFITEIGHNFLPFKEVTKGCYEGMFKGCSRLKTVPALPATKNNTVSEHTITGTSEGLAEECYKDMFNGCSSLQVAPDLPAIKLAKNCYQNLFYNCSILNNISTSYVGNFNDTFFQNWVYGVSSTGNIYYNGLDESKTYQYQIPTNFGIKQNAELISGYTETLTVKGDSTSIVPADGVKVRAYKDQTFSDIEDTLYKGTSADGEDFDHFAYYESSEEIDDDTKVEDLTEKTVKPVYLFDADIVDGWVNCFVSKETKLKLKQDGYNSGGGGGKKKNAPVVYYSTDRGATSTKLETNKTITIPSKTQLLLKCECITSSNKYYGPGQTSSSLSDAKYTNIIFTDGSVRLAGNCMNMCQINKTAPSYMPNDGCFNHLFANSTGITSITKGFLPCTNYLTDSCYCYMFSGCTNLKSVPNDLLPTTEFKWTDSSSTTHYSRAAYSLMFENCTSLTSAPNLPAETLYGRAYYKSNTFIGTYSGMFSGCSSLETAPEMAVNKIDDSASDAYGDMEFYLMFEDCTSLKTGPKINISDFSEIKHYGSYASAGGSCLEMFIGCTSLVSIDLTAIKKLGELDLRLMFEDCTSLKVNNTGDKGTLFFNPDSIADESAVEDMFATTGGTFKGDPVAKGKYYYEVE